MELRAVAEEKEQKQAVILAGVVVGTCAKVHIYDKSKYQVILSGLPSIDAGDYIGGIAETPEAAIDKAKESALAQIERLNSALACLEMLLEKDKEAGNE
jgi:hypothetical protein